MRPEQAAEAAAQFQRGVALHQAGQLADALASYERVLAFNPDHAPALNNRAYALCDLGQYEEALASCDRALAVVPEYADALNNRGNALHGLGRLEEALASYDRALAIDPDNAHVLNNRGVTLQQLARHEEALASYDRALALEPRYAAAHYNRGNALHDLRRDQEALASYDNALALEPRAPAVLNNRGNVLRDMCRLDEAAEYYRKSIAADPNHPAVHSALIFTLLRMSADPQPAHAQCALFARHFEPRIERLSHANGRDADRRLKVGYVSADFREHSVAHLIGPMLAHHDHDAVEIYCYSNHPRVDHVTETLRRHAAHWRFISGLSDDDAAKRVQDDGIDILVDLSGHTSHNRLLMFARKPAPVQVTWIGLPFTTGLSAIDYRLTNALIDPVGATERYHSESLVRLSTTTCFQPHASLPPVSELPALPRGCVTFGSFNEATKISPATVRLWSTILHSVPGSRLLAVCDAHSGVYIRDALLANGIAAERLVFVDLRPYAEYLALHDEVDIALDAFPYNGGTTTRVALSMGVPVVTLPGVTPVSRFGLALMSEVGLPEFAGDTEDDYVKIALRWAHDLPALANVRRTLRARVERAPFTDAKACTLELEGAYRRMWRAWCAA